MSQKNINGNSGNIDPTEPLRGLPLQNHTRTKLLTAGIVIRCGTSADSTPDSLGGITLDDATPFQITPLYHLRQFS